MTLFVGSKRFYCTSYASKILGVTFVEVIIWSNLFKTGYVTGIVNVGLGLGII